MTSPTLLALQDQVMANSVALLRMLALSAPAIIATDRLCEQLQGDGLFAQVHSSIEGSTCCVSITAQTSRLSSVSDALTQWGYDFMVHDSYNGAEYQLITWVVTIGTESVYLSAMQPVLADQAVLEAA